MPNAPNNSATSLAPSPALLNASLRPAPVGATKLMMYCVVCV
jgi:hypothetical protein